MLLQGIWQNNSSIHINLWIIKNCQRITKEDQRRFFFPDFNGYNETILIRIMWCWWTEQNIKQVKKYNVRNR